MRIIYKEIIISQNFISFQQIKKENHSEMFSHLSEAEHDNIRTITARNHFKSQLTTNQIKLIHM